MKVSELLSLNTIIPSLNAKDKEDVISQMVQVFKEDPRALNLEKIRDSILERERIMSTGVGKGFAIPHAKTEFVTEILLSFAKLEPPIDFDSADNKPVSMVFMIVGKESLVGPHIKLLARISKMMSNENFRLKLLNADSADLIFKLFQEEEQNYAN